MAVKKKVKISPKKQKSEKTKTKSVLLSSDGARLRKLSRKQSRKRKAEILKKAQQKKNLPPAWVILRQSLVHLYRYKKVFLWIIAIYAIAYFLFVKGFSFSFQLSTLKQNLADTFKDKPSSLVSGVALYGLLLGSSATTGTGAAGVYQTVLIVLVSLALIWALRMTYKGEKKFSAKDSYYKSTYPLIPFLAVMLVIILQFLPAAIAGAIYSTVVVNGLVVNGFQQLVAVAILLAGLCLTFFMLCSSIFALYITTLPGAEPIASLKAAKKLVIYRRIIVLRKILFLPLSMLLLSGLLLVPLIMFVPNAAEIVFMVLGLVAVGVVHSYLYCLYRYLIDDKQNDKN